MSTQETIAATYGKQLRLRVCGLCFHEEKLLLIQHIGLGEGYLWSPPGGGVEYGEQMPLALKREFLEETGLQIEVGSFLFTYEFIQKPLHAVELFFEVHIVGGRLQLGHDPEVAEDQQILKKLQYLSFEEIKKEKPSRLHGLFAYCDSIQSLQSMRGFYQSE